MRGLTLDSELANLPGFNARLLTRFHTLGLHTVRELLWHFPVRYEDYIGVTPIADLAAGVQTTVHGIVEEVSMRRTWKRHLVVVEATVADETGRVRAIWFNQPYVKNALRVGTRVSLSGKTALQEGDLYLAHPTYEQVRGDRFEAQGPEGSIHTGRLVPIYPETRGLTSKGIRAAVAQALKLLGEIPDPLPADMLSAKGLPELSVALAAVHFPEHIEDALAAKRRFTFEELFLLQLHNLREKARLRSQPAPVVSCNIEEFKNVLAALPFALTHSQKQSLWEIIKDMSRATPMNRLLQGDVGSGKTVVALLLAFLAAENGYQTALMAPTEVLARQHYATVKKLLSPASGGGALAPYADPWLPVAFLVSSGALFFYGDGLEYELSKKKCLQMVARGEVKIVIGTHALIQKAAEFKDLGLVIVDEQHRFGVRQRAHLARHTGTARKIPHFLSMSATPIPRTLMLTVFGDLDLSLISELPQGRKKIITRVVPPEKRTQAYAFIRKEVRTGRQAFVICPRIEIPETEATGAAKFQDRLQLEVRSVKEEYEKLSQDIFPDLRVGMLHGKLKSAEKEKIMREFREGRIDVLVSTSVIEVGVDVPNATIMMIEGADRFGLAQLYQFRGRVGRGEHQSYCFLFTDSPYQKTASRLQAIVEAKSGLELAEADLKLRGPGEFLGTKQTGLPDTAMRALQEPELIQESRAAAAELLETDPNLQGLPCLEQMLASFEKGMHQE